jgi:flagellar hook-length control protein FliK
MTVVLRPEALGEVRVRLEAKDGVVNARLSATTDAARRTLESGLETLRAALEARGVRVESLRIDPPDHQAADQSAQAGRADADARGTDQHQHRQHNADHQTPGPHGPRADSQDGASAAGNDASPEYPGRGIWTELGIDAVA